MNRRKYPMNWKAMRRAVLARAEYQCECLGECGVEHHGQCVEIHRRQALSFTGRVVLTVAHLDHDPETCRNLERLRAMCQKCHLRYDGDLHQRNAAVTRAKKKGSPPT